MIHHSSLCQTSTYTYRRIQSHIVIMASPAHTGYYRYTCRHFGIKHFELDIHHTASVAAPLSYPMTCISLLHSHGSYCTNSGKQPLLYNNTLCAKLSFARHMRTSSVTSLLYSLRSYSQSSEKRNMMEKKSVGEPLASGAPFDNVILKPFPVRAAIEIGTGSMITLAVARVDSRQGAIRDLLFQSQLPIHIQFIGGASNCTNVRGSSSNLFLTEKSRNDIFTKVRLMVESMNRDGPSVSEVSGLLTWPFYAMPNDEGDKLAQELSRTFMVDFRIVGRHDEKSMSRREARRERMARRLSKRHDRTSGSHGDEEYDNAFNSKRGSSHPVEAAEIEMDHLAFLSYAAAAKVIDRRRLVAIVENHRLLESEDGKETKSFCGGSIDLIGLAPLSSPVTDDGYLPTLDSGLAIHKYRLPADVMSAHNLLLRDIQRRDEKLLHSFSSPNPVHRAEASVLRNGLVRLLRGGDTDYGKIPESLPRWLYDKLTQQFGSGEKEQKPHEVLFAGASENGGMLNIASRAVGYIHIHSDSLDQTTDFNICGLTDVLLGHNYPNPQLILPQAALCSAIMKAFLIPKVEYLPQVSIAQAILIHPKYWAYSRKDEILSRVSLASDDTEHTCATPGDEWYRNITNRTFDKPFQSRSSGNPNLAPQYHNSSKTMANSAASPSAITSY
eukprot:Tbor_TRINITY_DN4361_c0_g3::TRINITY_DN4361_c0_g3_i1::g.7781::m.7781